MGKGSDDWQVFRSNRVSQLRFVGFESLDPTYLYFLLTGVDYTCVYVFCWSCGEGLTTERMMRWVYLGSRVGFQGGSHGGPA